MWKILKWPAVYGWKQAEISPCFPSWQEGYGAFTYSVREKDKVIEYVKNQKEHHKTETFYNEYKRLLIENGIEFDEKYLVWLFNSFGVDAIIA